MEATGLTLPKEIAFPATILALLVKDSSSHASTSSAPVPRIERRTALLRYSVHTSNTEDGTALKESRTFESPVAGELLEFCVKPGQLVRSANQIVARVLEPCLHVRQFHGMCTDCGAILTEVDYAGPTQLSRATVRMSHDDEELLVSRAEAERLERDTAERLLRDRKLSLIVDLDQTVIHATVDPTVGEWMQQPSNPNYDALRGVSTFKLAKDGSAVKPGEADDGSNCAYFVKTRPGLKGFLEAISELYEMHVYTMGTRSYAESVCRVIDPEHRYFGGRILSRSETESEGLTSKSLNRLFPCDTSMVVIIDDRADVWEWSPNLVKVIPYDFFVGIGDINGAFLPKRSVIDTAPPGEESKAPADLVNGTSEQDRAPVAPTVVSEDAAAAVKQQEAEATQVIEEQVQSRPLAKAQEALHAVAVEQQKAAADRADEGTSANAKQEDIPVVIQDEPVVGEEAVLKDDDKELERLRALLRRIHLDFYDAQGRLRDVKVIVPDMKRNVLDGVEILFSGVIPLNTPPQQAEIWRIALHFGAICHEKLNSRVTHVVAAKSDTAKVNAARHRRGITIVWAAWLFDSIAQWRRQHEEGYLIDGNADTAASVRSNGLIEPSKPETGPPSDESDFDVDFDATLEPPDIPVDVNWADADAELDALFNESDDSEAEGASSLGNKRPRTRSASLNPDGGTDSPTGSPLSKRQKLASSRGSKLKLSYDARSHEIEPSLRTSNTSTASAPTPRGTDDSDDEDYAAIAASMGM